ncbi:hypothetical protein BH10ACT8_BH10ACT8_11300 [soil metagenome]
MTITQNSPIALVVGVSFARNTGNRIATVRCPFCGRTHTHGWPETATPWRLSHCLRDRREYVITAPDGHQAAAR